MPPRSSFNPTETISLASPLDSAGSSPTLGPHRDPDAPRKRWYHYLPLTAAICMILLPQPSWLYVLVDYHLKTMHQPLVFLTHLLVTYTLFFMVFSALIVVVVRDPGPVTLDEPKNEDSEGLMDGQDDILAPGRWCRKCWGPKPERAHHCSICGRCVLKMDHHCPWMGAKCIGHRTYPAFLHFLLCITLVSLYIAVVCGFILWHAFEDPIRMNELMPVHGIFLTFYALVFTLVVGSFYIYHLYLVFINQTTIENLSPFLLLRHLPPLPRTGHDLSDPPLELELSRGQRNLVRDAHGYIRLYDLGWRRNFAQVFGVSSGLEREKGVATRWRRRLVRVWYGGGAPGDGRSFPRNPKSDELLQRLANELANTDDARRR